jgi:hypothetical protein
MASEKFANLAETTLASDYTSGGASITVASATGFPTTGVFRVRLGNTAKTIYRVDSVAGAVFTGGAEANDGNATTGQTAVNVATRAVAERFVQSPDADDIALYGGVSAADRYGPINKIGNPTTPAWAWQNQGGASVVEANGIVFFSTPSASTSIRSRLISTPATPWTATILLRSNGLTAGTNYCGLVLRESGTSKLYIYYLLVNGTLQAVKFTNDTTFSAVGAVNVAAPILAQHWHWLRITDNGTNLLFSLSTDGVNFVQFGSEGRTVFMAAGPNQFGLFGNVDSGAAAFTASFASWLVT